jgi:phage terminase small subunit
MQDKKAKALTIKQEKFIGAYVQNEGNATQAALEAYGTSDEHTAAVIGSENLRKPDIKERIDEALVSLRITPEYTLQGFKKLADNSRVDMVKARALENIASIQDMYPKHGNSLDIADGSRALVSRCLRCCPWLVQFVFGVGFHFHRRWLT